MVTINLVQVDNIKKNFIIFVIKKYLIIMNLPINKTNNNKI
jgi:hypothetical protein